MSRLGEAQLDERLRPMAMRTDGRDGRSVDGPARAGEGEGDWAPYQTIQKRSIQRLNHTMTQHTKRVTYKTGPVRWHAKDTKSHHTKSHHTKSHHTKLHHTK